MRDHCHIKGLLSPFIFLKGGRDLNENTIYLTKKKTESLKEIPSITANYTALKIRIKKSEVLKAMRQACDDIEIDLEVQDRRLK